MKSRSLRLALAAVRLVALAPAVAPAVAVAQQPTMQNNGRPITLEEAVRLAQQSAPSTVQARNTNRTSESAVRASLAQFIPTATLSYTGNQSTGTQFVQGTPVPTTGLPWSYSRSISSNVTLWDFGQRMYNYRAALANLDNAGANETLQRYNVALTVKTQYFNVLAAQEQFSAASQLLEQATQQLKVSISKIAAGVVTKVDSLTSAIQVGNAKLQILNAQNALRNANAALTRLVASPVTVTAVASDTSEVGRVDMSEAELAKLVDEGPAVKQSAATLAAAKSSHKAARTPYYPTITANASYGQNPKQSQGFNFGGGPSSTSIRFGFGMNYTIFQNYTREQTLAVAQATESNAEASYRDARMFAQQNLTTFLSNYSTAQQTIELQQLTIQAALEAMRVVNQRYNLGAASLLEVLQAQTTLDNARAALINARVTSRIAKANIEALIGRDLR